MLPLKYWVPAAMSILGSFLSILSPGAHAAGKGNATSMHEFTVKDIDGKDVKLSDFKGKVVLVVNVASYCGYTRQYDGLQKLYSNFKDKGLVVLGFPANEFGSQEPGSDQEIKEFCSTKFNVNFPMFSKIVVKGEKRHPLYSYLVNASTDAASNPEIRWNFEKFLVGKDGKVIARYPSKVAPEFDELLKAIEGAL